MLQELIMKALIVLKPYAVPIILALLALWKRVALARVSAEVSFNYQTRIEELRSQNTKSVNIHKAQFEVELRAYQDLWFKICDWRHEFRKYCYSDAENASEPDALFETARKNYFSAAGKFQTIFNEMVKYKPFVYGEVHKEIEDILRIYESEVSRIYHNQINGRETNNNWYEKKEKTIRELDKRVYSGLSEIIQKRIGLIKIYTKQ